MTPQEALMVDEASNIIGMNGTELFENYRKVARKALEKQIPKKLDYEGDGYDENGELIYDTAICRKCCRKFDVDYDEHFKYCPSCGQALDWSDEDA